MLYHLAYFVASLLLSFALCRIFIRFSQKMGALSIGSKTEVRWDSRSKPLVGGIVLFLAFLLLGSVSGISSVWSPLAAMEWLPLIVGSTLGFVVGLWDDAYNTRPLWKFSGQFACGLLLVAFGMTINITAWWPVNALLTVFWVVGIMNSFNMIDNMDGVSGSFSLGVITTTVVAVALSGVADSMYMPLLVGMIGAHLGFLYLNWNPSKLYMGDTGSQFLGFMLAFLGIRFFWNAPMEGAQTLMESTQRQLLLPVLVFSMTVLDTTFVTFARLGRGQSPFVGGKDHTTHHLAYIGVPQKFVAAITGGITFVSGALALVLMYAYPQWTMIHSMVAMAYIGLLFIGFGLVYKLGARREKLRELRAARQVFQADFQGSAQPAVKPAIHLPASAEPRKVVVNS